MERKIFLLAAAVLTVISAVAGDVDLENHVRKYWTVFNENTVPGDGGKNSTPALRAAQVRYLAAMMERFAPHLLEESRRIDRIFNWKPDTHLAILLFGRKKAAAVPAEKNPAHECTSWAAMPDMTGGKTVILHKNRDSGRKNLTVMRRAVPGKHSWIGSGSVESFYPTQGMNDCGLVVIMNSGDPVAAVNNSLYGLGTPVICRILLEECATADKAVELLAGIIGNKAYSHGKAGSIWLIGDADNVYIAENHARKIEIKAVKSGFAIRANAFHFPEMQKYSLLPGKSFIRQRRREFTVYDYLVNKQWRRNGMVTPADFAAASRIDRMDGDGYPPCGDKTIAGSTFVIDREFPDLLSTAYMVISFPRTSCYLPVPQSVQDIPEAILNGSLSRYSFELKDKKMPLLEADEFAALEKRLRDRHAAAVEKARMLLRHGKNSSARTDAARILNDAFAANCRELLTLIR